MALMRIRDYRLTFGGQAPDRRTVVAMIERGELFGIRYGKIWYVDPDRKSPAEEAASEKAETLMDALRVQGGK